MTSNRLQQLKQMLQDSPDDAFLLFALAKEYEKQGQEEEALAFYQKLKQQHPDYVGLYYHLGKWHERQEEWESAVSTYREGLDVAQAQQHRDAAAELRAALDNLEDW